MKYLRPLILISSSVLIALCLSQCKQKAPEPEPVEIEKPKPVKPSSTPKRSEPTTQNLTIAWQGSSFSSLIVRQPSDSLDIVEDEIGQKYIDNTISLTIKKASGDIFFKKTFTKASFSKYVDPQYMKTAILEGIVFDKSSPSELIYAASVSQPETDDFIPLLISISPSGSMSISLDTVLDVSGDYSD